MRPVLPRRAPLVAAAAALGLAAAGASAAQDPAGPPAPPGRGELRRYEASGFSGVDDAPLRRALARSLELYTAAAAADFGSTQLALSRGGREANPLIRRRGLVAPVKALSVWAVLEIEERLRRSRHDGWARLLRWSFVAFNLGLAAWNLASLPGRGAP